MGYRGKLAEQARARELRGLGLTLAEIAAELGVSKSSVSVWVRDVEIEPLHRRPSLNRRPHPQHLAKLAEIAEGDSWGNEQLGGLSWRDPEIVVHLS